MNTLAHSPALWLGAQDGKTFGYRRLDGTLKAPAIKESRRLGWGPVIAALTSRLR
jgi:hypothetical protein